MSEAPDTAMKSWRCGTAFAVAAFVAVACGGQKSDGTGNPCRIDDDCESTGALVCAAGKCVKERDTLLCGSATLTALAEAAEQILVLADKSREQIAAACGAIAGADVPASPSDDDLSRLCDQAMARIDDEFAQAGDVRVAIRRGYCRVDAETQVACEGRCARADGCACEPGSLESRCEPEHTHGACPGECTGACNGLGRELISCGGTCDGLCSGACDGQCRSLEADGACLDCDGPCLGDCWGECAFSAESATVCPGRCRGECSVPFEQAACEAVLEPPTCTCGVSEACLSACRAVGALKATCEPPGVEVFGIDPPWPELSQALTVLLEWSSLRDLQLDQAYDVALVLSDGASRKGASCDAAENDRLDELAEATPVAAVSFQIAIEAPFSQSAIGSSTAGAR